MSEPRDYRGYPCKPRQISDRVWYYEQQAGLDIHIDVNPHIAFRIPWRRVEEALRNRREVLRKARRKNKGLRAALDRRFFHHLRR